MIRVADEPWLNPTSQLGDCSHHAEQQVVDGKSMMRYRGVNRFSKIRALVIKIRLAGPFAAVAINPQIMAIG
jgi:hypothetical protein